MIVWWWDCTTYAETLAESFELLWYELGACIRNYFVGQPIFWKSNLTCFYYVICTEPLHLLYDHELPAVIYNTKIMLVIEKMSDPTGSHSLSGILCDDIYSLGHVAFKSRYVEQFLTVFLNLSIHVDSTNGLICHYTMSSLCPCNLSAAGSVHCSTVMQVLLFFYLSWQSHQLFQTHPWMTSLAAVLSVPQLSLMASPRVHILTTGPCAHHQWLPFFISLAVLSQREILHHQRWHGTYGPNTACQ